MGFAVPGSLGVYFANPKTKPIVLVGDGAFQMTGQEFGNLVRNKIPAIVFVLNNKGYGTERLMLDGDFNDICDWNYSKLVQAYGGKGYLVTTESELDYACDCAMSEKTVPSLIEIKIDKNDHSNRIKRMFVNLAKKVQSDC
jgi:indolepyruvate decarboxylase